MVAGVPADIPVALFSTGCDHDNAALLEHVAGGACLAEPGTSGPDGSRQYRPSQHRTEPAPQSERAVRLAVWVRQEGNLQALLIAEDAGGVDAPLSDHNELPAEVAHWAEKRTEGRDLLPGEQAPEVPNEHGHDRPIGPERSEPDRAAVGIEDDQEVENVGHCSLWLVPSVDLGDPRKARSHSGSVWNASQDRRWA